MLEILTECCIPVYEGVNVASDSLEFIQSNIINKDGRYENLNMKDV